MDAPQTTSILISWSNTWWDSSDPFTAPLSSLGSPIDKAITAFNPSRQPESALPLHWPWKLFPMSCREQKTNAGTLCGHNMVCQSCKGSFPWELCSITPGWWVLEHWHHSGCSGEEGLITGERVHRMWVNTLSLPLCLSSNTQSAIWLNFNPKQSSLKMKDLYHSIFACCN